VTTNEETKALRERGFANTHPLDTWSTITIGKAEISLRITALPGRHGPPLSQLVLPHVMGSMLEFQSSSDKVLFRIYISGDTLIIDDLREITRRYPDIDLGLLHLGGTKVLGIMVTMDGKQGIEAMQIVDPTVAIPIHYNDYDVFKSPLSDFQREIAEAGLEHRVHYLNHGQEYTFEVPLAEGNEMSSASPRFSP
jgi:L-ascorbate metabolism protein UlaG (beta-lactamase superfamily)